MANKGFTLIELLVSITIVAILSGAAAMGVSGSIKRSRDAQAISNINETAKVLELYYSINGEYPASLDELKKDPSSTTGNKQEYLKNNEVPIDPITGVTMSSLPFPVVEAGKGEYNYFPNFPQNTGYDPNDPKRKPITKFCLCSAPLNQPKGNVHIPGGSSTNNRNAKEKSFSTCDDYDPIKYTGITQIKDQTKTTGANVYRYFYCVKSLQ